MYQPAQGGSSERFFVWVFEAVQMLRPMLRTGQFESVKKSLDYIFSLQDAGFPPVGKFTTTSGAIGTTGPRWANTTGMALALACDYYLYSKDQQFMEDYLSKILKAVHWILGEIKATRVLNSDGSRPLTYGLMPFAVASDGDAGYFVSATDIFSFWGLEKAVLFLESIRHAEAVSMRKELEQYRSDLLFTIKHLAQPNGYIDRKITTDDSNVQEAIKFINTDIMAPIATVGIISPESELFKKYIDYYENNVAVDYFMGKMDREIFYIIQCEHYWQPIYLMLGEWKKAFMTLQTCLKYGMSHDAHQTQERFNLRNPAFAPWQPNGSGNGRIIDMMLNALYFENKDEVTILGGVPFEYLISNRITTVKNLYTLTVQDAYTLRQIQKEGPKGLSFQHYLNRLSLRGLVVSGIGLTGVDALYRLLGSLTIIPLKDTFPIRLFGCVQLYLEGTIGAKEFGRYLKKKPSSPMEDTILKLADKVSLTTAELVTSMEQEKVIHNESDIMDELYTEPETTYQTLVDDVQIHHTQYPVLQAIANLYLNKQITFHTC